MAAPPIVFEMVAKTDGLLKPLDKVKSRLGGLGKAFAATGAAVAGLGLAAGAALVKLGSEFDAAYDTIRIGTGATGDALEGLKDVFRSVARSVPDSFEDISTAVADLNTRLGITGSELAEASIAALNFADVTGTDVGEAIALVTRAMGDWRMDADEAVDMFDKLFVASQATGVPIGNLTRQIVQFGEPLRKAGFTMSETIALFAEWDRAGVNTETVMAGLNFALSKFASENVKNIPKAFDDAVRSIKNARTEQEALSIGLEVFGKRANINFVGAIRDGKFELDDLVKTLETSTETVAKARADTMDFGEAWMILRNQVFLAIEPLAVRLFNALGDGMAWVMMKWHEWEPTIERFADALVPKLEAGFTRLRDWFVGLADEWGPKLADFWETRLQPAIGVVAEKMREWADETWPKVRDFLSEMAEKYLPPVVAFIEDMGEAVGDFAMHIVDNWPSFEDIRGWLEDLGLWFEKNKTPILAALAGIAAGFIFVKLMAVGAAIASLAALWPVFLVAAAVAVLAGAFLYAYENNEDFRKGVEKLTDWIKTDGIVWLGRYIGFVKEMGEQYYKAFKRMEWVANTIAPAVELAVTSILKAWQDVFTVVDRLAGIYKALATTIINAIKPVANAAYQYGKAIVEAILKGISSPVGQAIQGSFDAIFQTIKGKLNRELIDPINSILPDSFAGVDLGKKQANPIPYFYAGGGDVLRSGPAIVGERGPELVHLPQGAHVVPNHEMSRGGAITVNVATNADPYQIGREVAWALRTSGA